MIYYGDVHVGTIALLRTGMAGSAKRTEADFQAHLQLSELNRLRDQVKQAQRFLARSRRPRRIPGLAGQWDWLASDRPDARLVGVGKQAR